MEVKIEQSSILALKINVVRDKRCILSELS